MKHTIQLYKSENSAFVLEKTVRILQAAHVVVVLRYAQENMRGNAGKNQKMTRARGSCSLPVKSPSSLFLCLGKTM